MDLFVVAHRQEVDFQAHLAAHRCVAEEVLVVLLVDAVLPVEAVWE